MYVICDIKFNYFNFFNFQMISVSLFSKCSKYIAAGSSDGTLYVWNVESGGLVYENADTKDHITGLMFSQSGKDIFAVDMKGRMIFVNDFLSKHDTQDKDSDLDDELGEFVDNEIEEGAVADADDPFDDDMDELLVDEDGNNEFSISKIKAMSGFIASENEKEDVFVGIDKAKKISGFKDIEKDDAMSVSSMDHDSRPASALDSKHHHHRSLPPAPIEMPFTKPQKPFQPSSSPETIDKRFMVGLCNN